MKSLAKYTWILVTALSAAGLIACAKAGPSANSNTGIYYPPYGTGCYNGVCSNSSQLAFYSQNSMMDQYYQQMGYAPNSYAHMTSGSGHKNLLKQAMGVCDRNNSDYGLADCSAWLNGFHDLVIVSSSLNASTVKVVFRSYPYQSNSYGWYASFPSFSEFLLGTPYNYYQVYNPMVLTMTVNPINNSQGFELRGYGPQNSAASGLLFQVQVLNGKLEDSNLNYQLYFNGAPALSGSMTRCSTLNCGLPFAI